MSQDSGAKSEQDFSAEGWVKSATDAWMSMMNSWTGFSNASAGAGKAESTADSGGSEAMREAFRNWVQMVGVAGTAGGLENFAKETGSFQEIALKMIQTGYSGYQDLFRQWSEECAKTGKIPERDFPGGSGGREFLEAWTRIYEKEIRPVFNMPQLGLTRAYQERMNQVVDKFAVYQTTLAEFLRVLSGPVEHSVHAMEEKIRVLAKEGKLSSDFKDYYNMWIKTLEGDYMRLFKSTDYVESLSRTINSVEDFNATKNEALADVLQFLPIPTNRDMDELYKELYSLKKMLKELKGKMDAVQTADAPEPNA
jgi:hypothetical protein